jgi:hypothetical protein
MAFGWESVTRFFASGFFHESSSPKSLKITLGSFQIFPKIQGDTHKSRCTTSIIKTGDKFASGVNDTAANFPPVSNALVENLPTVSTTPACH